MDLPEDVVFQILSWLPVMTLLRFKSVCKSWCSLIQSSTFATQQLRNNNAGYRGKGKVISKACYPSTGEWATWPNTYRLFYGHNFHMSADLAFDRHWYDPKDLKLIASCDGIICLHNLSTGEVALWNPATTQLRPLPESPIPRRPDFSPFPYVNQPFVAFYFDVKANDYKVVRIIIIDRDQVCRKIYAQVEVYSLSTDSWEIIHKDVHLPLYSLDIIQAAKNGMCFWLGYYGRTPMLLSFNLSNNVLGTVPLPEPCGGTESIDSRNVSIRSIDFMNDKLALIYAIKDRSLSHDSKRYEIWVLQDYHVNGSWVKHHTVGPFLDFVLGRFSMNGECLLVAGDSAYLYDIVTQERIILHDLSLGGYLLVQPDLISYNESLLQLQRVDPSQDSEQVSAAT